MTEVGCCFSCSKPTISSSFSISNSFVSKIGFLITWSSRSSKGGRFSFVVLILIPSPVELPPMETLASSLSNSACSSSLVKSFEPLLIMLIAKLPITDLPVSETSFPISKFKEATTDLPRVFFVRKFICPPESRSISFDLISILLCDGSKLSPTSIISCPL